MKTELYKYNPQHGWNAQPDPALDSNNTLVLIFSGLGNAVLASPLKTLTETFPEAVITGCTTAGEIFNDELSLETLVCAVIKFDNTRLQLANHPLPDLSESYDAGVELSNALDAEDLRAVFVLSEGLHVNGSQLIKGFNDVLGEKVVITGGLAGDGDRFENTWLICREGSFDRNVCAVGLYGDQLSVAHGSKGGWDRIGFEKEVTRSEGNVLYELDGQPALAIYKKYLGERADGLPYTGLLFPLALRAGHEDDQTRVRTILGIDEAAQSITFAGDLPQGSLVQLMHANFDRLIDGAIQAVDSMNANQTNGDGALCIAISCVGRRLALGQRTEEEIESTLEHLPPGTQQIGFYAYGELSPLASGKCDLHNQTMTLTLFQEG